MRVTITCAVTAALLALTGCGATESPTTTPTESPAASPAESPAASPTADPGPGSHTMPDGTVMDGTVMDGTVMEGHTHVHDDSHGHGPDDTTPGPSAAARMVCAGDVVDEVTRIMDASTEVDPTSSWQAPTFTCRFDLDAGPLRLSVHDATDAATGMAHFQTERLSTTEATSIKGVYNLGLPAYQTKTGIVSFIKDHKTLQVDATALSGKRHGIGNTKTPTQIAYAIATSVLACWTDHT